MVESILNENTAINSLSLEDPSEITSSYKIKPRAIIFKANEKDLDKIKELMETKFPAVEIIYITTGPAASILHVTKSMPSETQKFSSIIE